MDNFFKGNLREKLCHVAPGNDSLDITPKKPQEEKTKIGKWISSN
jgi:hypothetical protein